MIDFEHAIYVYNASLETVLLGVSQCQYFSEALNSKVCEKLSRKINENDNTLHQFFEVMKQTVRKKDTLVSFYIFDNKTEKSIYSNFFNIQNAFEFSKSFFEDFGILVVYLEIVRGAVKIELRKSKKILIQMMINLQTNSNEEIINEMQNIHNHSLTNEEYDFLIYSLLDFIKNSRINKKEQIILLKSCTSKEDYIL